MKIKTVEAPEVPRKGVHISAICTDYDLNWTDCIVRPDDNGLFYAEVRLENGLEDIIAGFINHVYKEYKIISSEGNVTRVKLSNLEE